MIYYLLYNLKIFSDEFAQQYFYELSPNGYLIMLAIGIISELAIFSLYYVFRSIGLYKMAKNIGHKNPALTIVPFYGLYFANSLAPKSKYVKNNDVFYILAIIFGAVSTACILVQDIFAGIPCVIELFKGNKLAVDVMIQPNYLTTIADVLHMLTDLGYVICTLFVFRNVFLAYSIEKSGKYITAASIVYVFTSSLFLVGIFTFVLRNNQRVNFDAYIENRRRFTQNPYGGGFGGNNPYGGNGQYGGNPYSQPQKPEVDPFEEFNNKQDGSDPFEEFDSKNGDNKKESDDLFD